MILIFWFKGSGGRRTKAVQGPKKFRVTHFEWRMLEGNGLRGGEARKKQKSPKIERKTPEIEHPPSLGSFRAASGRPKSNTDFFTRRAQRGG
jgi:hypothetical protein